MNTTKGKDCVRMKPFHYPPTNGEERGGGDMNFTYPSPQLLEYIASLFEISTLYVIPGNVT